MLVCLLLVICVWSTLARWVDPPDVTAIPLGLATTRCGVGQFGKTPFLRIATAALDGVVLLFEGLGDGVLVALDLRFAGAGSIGLALDEVTRLRQALNGFAQVLDMPQSVRSRLGGDEHAVCGSHDAMTVGPQFKTFAARVLASGVVFHARDRAQAQARTLMVGFQLRLQLARRIVHHQMVGSSCSTVAAFGRHRQDEADHQWRHQLW